MIIPCISLAGPNIIHQFYDRVDVVSPHTFKSASTKDKNEIAFLAAAMKRAEPAGSDPNMFSQILILDFCASGSSNFKSILRPELLESTCVLLDPDSGYFTLTRDSRIMYKLRKNDLLELKNLKIIEAQH
jgi:hypothetical protein